MRFALYRQDVAMARSVLASAQAHDGRSRLFVELELDGVTSYGEVAPQPVAQHGDPGFDDVVEAALVVGAHLRRALVADGTLPSWRRVHGLASGRAADAFACALFEMAILDRELQLGLEDLTTLWPTRYVTPRQSTVSLLDDVPWTVGDGVARVRAKVAPGTLDPVALERLVDLGLPVLLDYNCSALDDDQVCGQVAELLQLADIAAVEQPYATGNLIDHSRLAARLGVPLSLDEGVRTVRDLRHVAHYGAASLVCVKPARVGGLANARTMIELGRELGLRTYLGGFFESPFARGVHRALASTCVTEPSDLDDVLVMDEHEEVLRGRGGFGLEPSRDMLARAEVLPVTL